MYSKAYVLTRTPLFYLIHFCYFSFIGVVEGGGGVGIRKVDEHQGDNHFFIMSKSN